MRKIDRFLGQFSEVLCTALHQWVEVSYVTKWFHHQENIFFLRIITMIWPNHKNHNSNFLDSSLIAVPFEKNSSHVQWFPHDDSEGIRLWKEPRFGTISSDGWLPPWGNDLMSQLNGKWKNHRLKNAGFWWGYVIVPGRVFVVCLVGVSRILGERDGITWGPAYNHRQKIQRFSGNTKNKYSLCCLVSIMDSKTSHPGELF